MRRAVFSRLFLTLLVAALASRPTGFISASIQSCLADVQQPTVLKGTQTNFEFGIANTDPTNDIRWIKVTRPSANFSINGASSGGWSDTNTQSSATFTGGVLFPGQENFSVFVGAGVANNTAPSANWTIQVSDDPNGSNPTTCPGDQGTEIIEAETFDTTPPIISNISVSILSLTSVRIRWNTNEPATSQVEYGQTTGYGQDETAGLYVLSHDLTLRGLTPDTGYHYRLNNTDARDNVATTADNTFFTGSPGQSATPQPEVTAVPNASDRTPPKVTIVTDLTRPFKEEPAIKAVATDNGTIGKVEYSTDGGLNWLPADSIRRPSATKAESVFTPQNLEDNNYYVAVRAYDAAGNVGLSALAAMVIDRIPPAVGGNVVSLGAQTITPNKQGIITTLAGMDEKLTLSAVGGATSITVTATKVNQPSVKHSFTLAKPADGKLWSGLLSYLSPGIYDQTVVSEDGAGNVTRQQINRVSVLDPPQIVDQHDLKPVYGGTVTMYWFDTESNRWLPWDGEAYSQHNPQRVNSRGSFSYVVPAGKYYLKATASGYQPTATTSFEVEETTVITSNIEMPAVNRYNLLGINIALPNPIMHMMQIGNPTTVTANVKVDPLIGKSLPSFSLPLTSGKTFSEESLEGKPSLITVLASWSPASKDQILALAELQKQNKVKVVPVFSQENTSFVKAYLAIAGYNMTAAADRDGVLTQKLSTGILPTHYFVDSQGIIKKVKVGNFTGKELLEELTSMGGI